MRKTGCKEDTEDLVWSAQTQERQADDTKKANATSTTNSTESRSGCSQKCTRLRFSIICYFASKYVFLKLLGCCSVPMLT